MIRPFTFVALLLAAASGLYLYQTKHRAEVLDGKIAQMLHQVAAARERTGLLAAEWAWLNEPERLSQLAGQYLALQQLTPSRYVTVADLASRLPEVVPPTAVAAAPADDTVPGGDAPASTPAPVRVAETPPVQAALGSAPSLKPMLIAATAQVVPAPRPAGRPVPAVAAAVRSTSGQAIALSSEPSPARSPVSAPVLSAPVLNAVATPITRAAARAPARAPALMRVGIVAAQPSVPAVTSALGGFGRVPLAPPVPLNGN
jgi:hypothetical protein